MVSKVTYKSKLTQETKKVQISSHANLDFVFVSNRLSNLKKSGDLCRPLRRPNRLPVKLQADGNSVEEHVVGVADTRSSERRNCGWNII